MNDVNIQILNSLGKKQYYDFVRHGLGYKAFIEMNGTNVYRKNSPLKAGSSFPMSIAYSVTKDDERCDYLVEQGDADNKVFRDNKGNIYSTRTFFDCLDDSIVYLLLQGCQKM